MSLPSHLPLTRQNVAASSGGRIALFDCLECADGIYVPGPMPTCSRCGALASTAMAKAMHDHGGKKRRAA